MMADQPTRRLLHLLISSDSANAFEIATQQQQSGLGRPLLIVGPQATDLSPPANLEAVRLVNDADGGVAGSAKTIGYRELLRLIDESDSVSIW